MLSLCEGGTWTYLQQIRLRRALLILLKLLTRRLSVILERLGQVGVIQISTLVHYQRGGGGPRAGGGQGSSRARANARTSSGGGQSVGRAARHNSTRGYDLPAVVSLLEVHRGVAHYLLLGI